MLRIAPELAFPENERPYIESFRGRLCAKVSPFRIHGVLQVALGSILAAWAGSRGNVASEWRFFLTERDGRFSTLLPDLAYMSFDRLPKSTVKNIRERPTIAPNLAIEIISPGDRKREVDEKTQIYLACGSILVLLVDYVSRTITARDEQTTRVWQDGETFTDDRFPGLAIDLAAQFAKAD